MCSSDLAIGGTDRVRVECIPVRFEGVVVAIVSREEPMTLSRRSGELERTYSETFERFAAMIADGSFPFPGDETDLESAPRTGDGVILVDAETRVEFASPNAVSSLHRMGIHAYARDQRLADVGLDDAAPRSAMLHGAPVTEEIEHGDTSVLVHVLPILAAGRATGALMLMRDVSDIRRRDRMLLSKDATIREIHHRVKNNLQTISSLLRLQARRLSSDEAKAAVNESVRRIRTIALVHETLSREPGDDVAFIEIVRPLLRLAEEGYQSPDRPVRFTVQGEGGKLPATIATPLSVVLTELLQNAVDHEFPIGSSGGQVKVVLANDGATLSIRVIDDGLGVPAGFELDKATGLGLTIVKTLVTTELGGSILMRQGTPGDFEAVGLPAPAHGTGTVVDLTVPIKDQE